MWMLTHHVFTVTLSPDRADKNMLVKKYRLYDLRVQPHKDEQDFTLELKVYITINIILAH